MKKTIGLTVIVAISFATTMSVAQLRVKQIEISTTNVLIAYSFHYSDGHPGDDTYPSDSINSGIGFNANSMITVSDSNVAYNRQRVDTSNDGSTRYYEDGINLTIDTVKKVILRVDAFSDMTWYYNPLNTSYKEVTTEYMRCANIPYSISSTGDTIHAFLRGTELNGIGLSEANYSENETRFTYYLLQSTSIIGIPDSATLSIDLIGTFPLEVKNFRPVKEEGVSIYTDIINRSIIVRGMPSFQHTHQCFDLLGRTHELSIVRGESNSQTLSIATLSPGIYFIVSNGRSYKFLISG